MFPPKQLIVPDAEVAFNDAEGVEVKYSYIPASGGVFTILPAKSYVILTFDPALIAGDVDVKL